jgi:hypothetical protein
MQFIVSGYDGKDEHAMARRVAVREDHLAVAKRMHENGELLYAAALLDEAERMVGSTLIVAFPDRAALDKWLEVEPYVTSGVWKTIEVTPCKVPAFLKP